jgi:Ca-activated chloride channel homolog
VKSFAPAELRTDVPPETSLSGGRALAGTLLLGLVLFSSQAYLEAQPSLRVDAEYVRVPVTVLDEQGRTILDLTANDFRLYDEGVERPIRNFLLDESPINVVFLLDVSGSVQDEFDEIRNATIRFAQAFGPDDRMALVSFSDETRLMQDWTGSLRDLRRSLRRLEQGYRTAVYDALLETAADMLARVDGKRVVIMLTDGIDNESQASYDETMTKLTRLGVVLYIVSRTRLVQSKVAESERVEFLDRVMRNVLRDDTSFVDVYFREREASMNHLAEVNAGRVLYPERLRDLGRSYVQIAQELKGQYLLTFAPPTDSPGEFREIRVVCRRDIGQIYHRRLYRAP